MDRLLRPVLCYVGSSWRRAIILAFLATWAVALEIARAEFLRHF